MTGELEPRLDPHGTPTPSQPTVTLELAYEPDDGALAEAIAILLDDGELEADKGAAA